MDGNLIIHPEKHNTFKCFNTEINNPFPRYDIKSFWSNDRLEKQKILAAAEDDGFLRRDLRDVYETGQQRQSHLLAIEDQWEEPQPQQRLQSRDDGVFIGWAGKHTEYATKIVMVQVRHSFNSVVVKAITDIFHISQCQFKLVS